MYTRYMLSKGRVEPHRNSSTATHLQRNRADASLFGASLQCRCVQSVSYSRLISVQYTYNLLVFLYMVQNRAKIVKLRRSQFLEGRRGLYLLSNIIPKGTHPRYDD